MTDPITIQAATDAISAGTGLISALSAFIAVLFTSVTSIITACAVIAKYTPPPDRPGRLLCLHRLINAVGQNSGYAANAPKGGQ